jgi:hypothetical protein
MMRNLTFPLQVLLKPFLSNLPPSLPPSLPPYELTLMVDHRRVRVAREWRRVRRGGREIEQGPGGGREVEEGDVVQVSRAVVPAKEDEVVVLQAGREGGRKGGREGGDGLVSVI